MAVLGSPNYRVGLIISKAQPFNNSDLKLITDALMKCDEVIFSVRDYDTSFFDYNIAQKLYRSLFKLVDRVAFFGTEYDSSLGTPKHFVQRTLDKLEEARYHMPTHFFTDEQLWVDAGMESHLETVRTSKLFDHDNNLILQSVIDGTDYWKDRVPYALVEDIETYIATKKRTF